jgi:hypothetical protein
MVLAIVFNFLSFEFLFFYLLFFCIEQIVSYDIKSMIAIL